MQIAPQRLSPHTTGYLSMIRYQQLFINESGTQRNPWSQF